MNDNVCVNADTALMTQLWPQWVCRFFERPQRRCPLARFRLCSVASTVMSRPCSLTYFLPDPTPVLLVQVRSCAPQCSSPQDSALTSWVDPRPYPVVGVLEREDWVKQLGVLKAVKPSVKHVALIGDDSAYMYRARCEHIPPLVDAKPVSRRRLNVVVLGLQHGCPSCSWITSDGDQLERDTRHPPSVQRGGIQAGRATVRGDTSRKVRCSARGIMLCRLRRYNNETLFPRDEWALVFLSYWTITNADGVGIGASDAALYSWVRANNHLGELFFSTSATQFGMAVAAGTDGRDQGVRAGLQAALLLEGRSATDMVVQTPVGTADVSANQPRITQVAGMSLPESLALTASTVYGDCRGRALAAL